MATDHPRKLIRQAIVAAIVAANTAAGSRVKASVSPWRAADLPAISVFTPRETVDEEITTAEAPREYSVRMDLVIECSVRVEDPAEAQDVADDLAWEVRKVVTADRYLGDPKAGTNLAAETAYRSTEIHLREDGDQPIVVAELTYEVIYRFEDVPEVQAMAPFLEAGTTLHATRDDTPATHDHGDDDPADELVLEGAMP
jgi:hypothetical protein